LGQGGLNVGAELPRWILGLGRRGVAMGSEIGRREFLKSAGAGGLLLTPVGSALLTACGEDSEPEASPAANGVQSLTLQLAWLRIVQFGGHFVADEKGYFQDEGIDAEFLAGGPGIDAVVDVAAGKVPIGCSDTASLILARDKGIPVKAFGTIFQQDPFSLISLETNPVLTLQDMVGKTVGVPDVYKPTLLALLIGAGIDEDSVDIVPVGIDPSILTNEQVDGYMGSATAQGVQLQNRGFDVNIVSVTDLGDASYGNCFFVLDETFENEKESLINWLRADTKGWEFAVNNPEETARLTFELYGVESGVKLEDELVSAERQVPYITAGDGEAKGVCWIDPARWDTVATNLVNAGAIEEAIPAEEVMTQEILQAVYGV
jgi:ABC-type nitrate/sulfonate/bicarbonate transport system substrate-binding protein